MTESDAVPSLSEPTEPPATRPLSLSDFVRAAMAPAIGYLITVGGGVIGTGLVILALVTGAGDSSSDVSKDDASAVMFVIGMPFQLAGMGLFGSLGVKEAGVHASVFAVPIVLTVLFVAATAITARRIERRAPAPLAHQLVLSGVTGLGVAGVITALTALLAMRADDVSAHATTPGLFLGAAVLGTGAALIGRLSVGADRPWDRLPRDVRSASLLGLQLAVVWGVGVGLVLGLVAAFRDGFWTLIVSPLWAPTAGLDAMALGHLGAISVVGSTEPVWKFGVVATIAFVVLAIAGLAAATLAWHLRRDQTTLDRPESWLVLPGVTVGLGLVQVLVTTVHAGGGIADVGGGTTAGPAVWTIGVYAAWAFAAEAGSRSLAPALVDSLPDPVRAFLARGAAPARTSTAAGAAAPLASRPMSVEERRLLVRALIVGAAVVALVVGALVTRAIVNSAVYGPRQAAEKYLDLVVAGKVGASQDLAPVDTSEGSRSLLSDRVYRAADKHVTGYDVTSVDTAGDTATVHLRLKGLGGPVKAQLTLDKTGHNAAVFDRWELSDGGLAVPLTFDDDSLDKVGIGDATASLDGNDTYWVLPGTYSFDPYVGDKWVTADVSPTVVAPARDFSDATYVELPEAAPSDALKGEVDDALTALLDRCMKSTELEPKGCPQSAYGLGDDVRNVSWKLASAPTFDYSYFDGTFPADFSYDDEGRATVTYEYDASYGYGAPDWTKESDESDLYLDAKVDRVGDELSVTFE